MNRPFIVREYIHFRGDTAAVLPALAFSDETYAGRDLQLDLVLSYLLQSESIDGWLDFVHRAIARYGAIARFLQVTLEPNFNHPGIDGSSPGVRDALVQGMIDARAELDRLCLTGVDIGFSVAEPQEWAGGDGDFWTNIANRGGSAFVDAIGYVGLGLYPDAFSPVAPLGQPGDVPDLTRHALRTLREVSLPQAGISTTVPIHVAESGTPTGPERSQQYQAATLRSMIGTIMRHRREYNVTT